MTQFTVLITDTNIWIDLRNGGILEDVIQLPYDFMVPDIAQGELSRQVTWDELISLGVKEGNLTGEQVIELTQIRLHSPALSAADIAAFILARDMKAILLTGEDRLRKMALSHNLQVHGLLWLFDEMVQTGVLAKKRAYHALILIMSTNPRLPKEECQKRLSLYLC